MNTRSLAFAVVIAGLAIGLFGNLPFINLINCILCLWVWLGGGLAVLLYRRFQGTGGAGPTPGQGAALGAIAGVIGAIFGFFVYAATAAISAPVMESLARALQVEGEMPTEISGSGGWAGAFIFLVIDIVLYPLFGALGGFLTANMKKKAA